MHSTRSVILALTILAAPSAALAQSCDPHWSGAFTLGFDAPVRALHVFDDGSGGGPALYAAGEFHSASGTPVAYVAKWTGSAWSPVGTQLDSDVLALATFDDGSGSGPQLYAAGSGIIAGGQSVARWNGSAWQPVAAPFGWSGWLASYDSGTGPELYTSGGWSLPSGSSYIARWDGHSAWRAVGPGLGSVVHDALVYNQAGRDVLLCVGSFPAPTPPFSVGIGSWDGAAWSSFGGGFDGHANALAMYDDGSGGGPALFVGGGFLHAGQTTFSTRIAASHIAKWDGSAWSALGAGLNNEVMDLAVFDDGSGSGPKLYAAGRFTLAGTTTATRIAVWDGHDWSALDSGITGSAPPGYTVAVETLAVFPAPGLPQREALYAGGLFQSAGGIPSNYIAARVARQPADLNADGLLDFADYLEFLNLYETQDPRVDFNHDGLIDFLDYLEFLNLYNTGC